jgi:DNA-binding ferritin-like protein
MKEQYIDSLTKLCSVANASRLCHWNISGKGNQFYSMHLLFAKIYELAEEHVDELAEQARGSDVEIPAKVFHEVPEIEWSTNEDMVEELYKVVEDLCESLDSLHKKADSEDEFGVLNVVEGLMTVTRKIKYLLSSTISEDKDS